MMAGRSTLGRSTLGRPTLGRSTLSVAIIACNEETNLARTLASVRWTDEIVVVDSGSTDRTVEVARAHGAKVFVEAWKGFAAQKNSALAKCTGDWILSLDADEEVSEGLRSLISALLAGEPDCDAYFLPRRNLFLGRWMRHGGLYPDAKLRLFKLGSAKFEERPVHETLRFEGKTGTITHPRWAAGDDLIHYAYPTLEGYIDHMNRYSTLGAQTMLEKTSGGVLAFAWNALLNPLATFAYNYFFRLGFLDGAPGLIYHINHSVYVHWKYVKAWEARRPG
jgi:glycosyltransferase involved in cell wall biosynthesis